MMRRAFTALCHFRSVIPPLAKGDEGGFFDRGNEASGIVRRQKDGVSIGEPSKSRGKDLF